MRPNFFDKEAEDCVISAFLRGENKLNASLSMLNAELFTGLDNLLFKVMRKIVSDSLTPDELLTDEYIRRFAGEKPEGYNGIMTLVELKDRLATTSNIGHYIARLKTAWEKRRLEAIIRDSQTALDNGSFEVRDIKSRLILESVEMDMSGEQKVFGLDEIVVSVADDMMKRLDKDYVKDSIDTGIPTVDDCTNGYQRGSLNLIGARPSHGKTALALSMFRNILKKDIPCGFVSLEMTAMQLVYRLQAMSTGFSQSRIASQLVTQGAIDKINNCFTMLAQKKGFIVDSPNAYLSEVEASVRMLVLCKGCRIVFIDYAGLITLDGDTSRMPEYERASVISKRIKRLARSLNVPIVLLVQLNRDAQGRSATMANIRGSGSYEQDADTIILIQREESDIPVRTKDSAQEDVYGSSGTNGTTSKKSETFYLDLNKNRNGPTNNKIPVVFNKPLTLFYEPEQKQQ